MKLNPKTLLLIFAVTVIVLALTLESNHLRNVELTEGLEERESKDALKMLIDSSWRKDMINDSLRGKTVVINAWASWCVPCLSEMPELNKLVKDFASDKVIFIALDDRDSITEMRLLKAANINFDYHLLFWQATRINALYALKLAHETRGYPLDVVLNKDGQVRVFITNYRKPNALDEVRDYLESVPK